MKIQDIRIGMEVKSSGNDACTYFVVQIGPKDKVTVEFRKGCKSWEKFHARAVTEYVVYANQLSPVKNRKTKTPAAPSIESRILKILDKGTKIVSFDYDNVLRNVLVGTSKALESPRWGTVENRAIRFHNGRKYLVGVDNNSDHQLKTFALDKIQNPSF